MGMISTQRMAKSAKGSQIAKAVVTPAREREPMIDMNFGERERRFVAAIWASAALLISFPNLVAEFVPDCLWWATWARALQEQSDPRATCHQVR